MKLDLNLQTLLDELYSSSKSNDEEYYHGLMKDIAKEFLHYKIVIDDEFIIYPAIVEPYLWKEPDLYIDPKMDDYRDQKQNKQNRIGLYKCFRHRARFDFALGNGKTHFSLLLKCTYLYDENGKIQWLSQIPTGIEINKYYDEKASNVRIVKNDKYLDDLPTYINRINVDDAKIAACLSDANLKRLGKDINSTNIKSKRFSETLYRMIYKII